MKYLTKKEERLIVQSASTSSLYQEMERRGYAYDERRDKWIDLNQYSIQEIKDEIKSRASQIQPKKKIVLRAKQGENKGEIEKPKMLQEPQVRKIEQYQLPEATYNANGGEQNGEKKRVTELTGLDEAGWAKMFDRFNPLIQRMGMRMLPSDQVGELVQDVDTLLWKTSERYDPSRAALVTWVMLLTRRQCVDRLRRIRRTTKNVTLEEATTSSQLDTARSVDEYAEEMPRVKYYLSKLPLPQQDILQLVYERGLTIRKAAETLNVPLGTAKTHLNRGLKELRQQIGIEQQKR